MLIIIKQKKLSSSMEMSIRSVPKNNSLAHSNMKIFALVQATLR